MSGIVKWVIKLTMTSFIVIALFKQCISFSVVTEGFFVTGVSMHRLCLNDTANENRVYYLVKYNGYRKYNLALKVFFQCQRPRWQTPLNDIDGISVFDSTNHEMSDRLHFYNGDFYFQSVNTPDSELYLGAREKNMKERNERMKRKSNFSVEDFAFYVDKSGPQPYEIRMRLDSCEVRSLVKKDTMRWMFR